MGVDSITTKNLDIVLHDRVPDGQWEIVDVAFPATAHADFQIPHSLSPESAEQVEYTVLRQSTPGTVYEDRSATRTKWSPGFIILRSDTGGWTGRLLLRVLKRSLIWFPGQNAVYTPPVTGILGVADGGTGADLSATGPGYLKQAGVGSVVSVASNIPAGDIGSGQLALARGGTHADLSATGGTSKFLKQASAGADITVVQPAIADLSDGSTVVVTGGSYADPAWLTALDMGKLTGQAYAKVYKTANQTGIGTSYVLLTWNAEDSDPTGMHDNSTNNSRITVATAGTYLVGGLFFVTDATAGGGGWAYIMARKNAAGNPASGTYLFENKAYGPNAGVSGIFAPAFIVVLAANDYVEIFAKSTQGGAAVTVAGGAVTNSHFALVRLA